MQTQFWHGAWRAAKLMRALAPSREAYVIYHGFPGEPPPAQAEKYKDFPKKCIDVAQALYQATGQDVFLPHYEGLGESAGKFSFMGSVVGAISFERWVSAQKYERVHLIGNSWGGLVAYNVYRGMPEKRGRLVLISALLDLQSEEWIRGFLPYYVLSYPKVLGADPDALERAVKDLENVRRRFNPASFAADDELISLPVLMIHGSRDSEVPVGGARRFAKAFGCRLLELDADHSYSTARAAMVSAVVAFAQEP